LEKEVLVLNQEKKVLCEKTLKYDQLFDQKRRIEEIVDQMKSTEVFRLYQYYLLIKIKFNIIMTIIVNIII